MKHPMRFPWNKILDFFLCIVFVTSSTTHYFFLNFFLRYVVAYLVPYLKSYIGDIIHIHTKYKHHDYIRQVKQTLKIRWIHKQKDLRDFLHFIFTIFFLCQCSVRVHLLFSFSPSPFNNNSWPWIEYIKSTFLLCNALHTKCYRQNNKKKLK